MDRRRPARGGARGGEDVPPPRTSRTGIAAGIASVGCVAGLVVLALAGAGDAATAVGARLAAGSLLALVAALVLGWTRLLSVSLLFVGAAYAARLSLEDVGLDSKAPLFAAGLLLTAELAYWSLEEREQVRGEPGDDLRRLGLVITLTLGALLASAVLLAVADLARTGGLAIDLLGTAAAAAALLVVLLVGRRGARG